MDACARPDDVRRLWEACQLPDFRKLSKDEHAQLAVRIAAYIVAAEGPRSEPMGRRRDRQARSHRRRSRRAAVASRARAHLDLRRQPRRLAGGRRRLARAHARGGGQALRRAARSADAAFHRPPHQRAAQGPEARRRAARRHLRRGRGDRRGPFRGPARRAWSSSPIRARVGLEGRAVRNAACGRCGRKCRAGWRASRRAADDDIALGRDGRVRVDGAAVARLAPGAPVLKPRLELIGAEGAAQSSATRARERLEALARANDRARSAPAGGARNGVARRALAAGRARAGVSPDRKCRRARSRGRGSRAYQRRRPRRACSATACASAATPSSCRRW